MTRTGAATAPQRAGGPQRPLMRRWHDGTGMGPVWQVIIFLGGIIPGHPLDHRPRHVVAQPRLEKGAGPAAAGKGARRRGAAGRGVSAERRARA